MYPIYRTSLINCCKWISIKNDLHWQTVEKSFEYVSKFGDKVGLLDTDKEEREFFDEISYVKRCVDTAKINTWNEYKVSTDKRWIEIFNHFEGI